MTHDIVYLLFHKNSDTKRRNDNRAGFMENLFTTGDFQKDVLTLKNTLINTKISHIEHVPKDKDNNQTSKFYSQAFYRFSWNYSNFNHDEYKILIIFKVVDQSLNYKTGG